MLRLNNGGVMIKPRRASGIDRVFNAICLLAREYGTTPPQTRVAEHLGVSKQYVSNMMLLMEKDGLIEWIDRYTYRVDDSTWTPPPNVEI